MAAGRVQISQTSTHNSPVCVFSRSMFSFLLNSIYINYLRCCCYLAHRFALVVATYFMRVSRGKEFNFLSLYRSWNIKYRVSSEITPTIELSLCFSSVISIEHDASFCCVLCCDRDQRKTIVPGSTQASQSHFVTCLNSSVWLLSLTDAPRHCKSISSEVVVSTIFSSLEFVRRILRIFNLVILRLSAWKNQLFTDFSSSFSIRSIMLIDTTCGWAPRRWTRKVIFIWNLSNAPLTKHHRRLVSCRTVKPRKSSEGASGSSSLTCVKWARRKIKNVKLTWTNHQVEKDSSDAGNWQNCLLTCFISHYTHMA